MAAATHLTASMRVIRAHLKMRHVTVQDAHDDVKALALRAVDGTLHEDDARLIAKLEKACGCSLSELAIYADGWID